MNRKEAGFLVMMAFPSRAALKLPFMTFAMASEASLAVIQRPLVIRAVMNTSRRPWPYWSTRRPSTSIRRFRKAVFSSPSQVMVTSRACSIWPENSSRIPASSSNWVMTAARLSRKRFFQVRFMVARPRFRFSCPR